MAKEPIKTWYFVLAVVCWEDKFLLVQEYKHNQLWYLPAGRVEPGETFIEAVHRETLEESAIAIELEGILRIEHTPLIDATARVRVVFKAKPKDNLIPKTIPDQESLKAAWVSLAELHNYPLRGAEVRNILNYVSNGATVFPIELIKFEGEKY